MSAGSILWLVVNSASGSNDADAVAALEEALRVAEAAPDRTIDCAKADLPDRAALEAVGVATLAIYTGDGTINALVPQLEGWGGAVLVLPGGTANLLAKTLHGERAVDEIVAAFGKGELHSVECPCIRSGARTALIELLAGPGAAWADVREGLREGDLAGIANATVEAVRQSTDGPGVTITDPPLGKPEGYTGVRMAPGSDGMTVDGYGADSVADYLKQGLALLKRDFREGPHDELGRHDALTCESADGSEIELMIDGERAQCPSPARFELARLHVRLLAHGDG